MEEALTNFIPINRELFEHYLWIEKREYSRFEAWLYLIKEARFEETKVLDKGRLVPVKRGQIYASVRFLGSAFGWSVKKVDTFLKLLENDKMVDRETSKETGQTIITICNYDKYNKLYSSKETPKKQQGDSGETLRKQRGDSEGVTGVTKSNRVKKENKEKRVKSSKGKAELVFPFSSPLFLKKWEQLVDTPKWKKKLSPTLQLALDKLKDFEEEFVIELLDHAIIGEWQGLVFTETKVNYQKWLKQRGVNIPTQKVKNQLVDIGKSKDEAKMLLKQVQESVYSKLKKDNPNMDQSDFMSLYFKSWNSEYHAECEKRNIIPIN